MEWYPWLNKIYFQILSSYQDKKGHHFLLIQSKKDNGLDSLVYALSRWLMCCDPVGRKSCNICNSCYLMKSHSHPDYYSLEPDECSKSIGVDRVRVLTEKLYQYAHIANLKIVYVKSSEWLTEEAMNALLKIFEEPPSYVYFFLGCRDFTCLLPTLLSRCLHWVLPIPREVESLCWLRKKGIINSVQATTALRLCDGAPLEAYFILTSDYWKLRLLLCKQLKKTISNNNFLNILPFIESRKEGKVFVFWLCSLLIDAWKWNFGLYDFLVNIDQIDLIRCITIKFSLLQLNNQLQQWLVFMHYWDDIPYMNKKLLLVYQLLNIEGNVKNFI